jgi:hypothetical protein
VKANQTVPATGQKPEIAHCKKGVDAMDHVGWGRLSALSGLASGIAWTVGDFLIVGFAPSGAVVPAMAGYSALERRLATWMLEGSTARLASGALAGAFSAPLMLFALLHVYQLLRPAGRVCQKVCVALLFAGFSLSPLAHAAYFYVGEAYKTAILMGAADSGPVFALGEVFIRFLLAAYIPAVGLTGAGWLLASIAMLANKTSLPRAYGLLTPLPLAGLITLAAPFLPGALSVYLSAAAMNIPAIVFYTLTSVHCLMRRDWADETGSTPEASASGRQGTRRGL